MRLPLTALDLAAPQGPQAAGSANFMAEAELHFHRVPRAFRTPRRAAKTELPPPHFKFRPNGH